MSADLLPVTVAWLERLPDGVLLTGHGASGLRRTGRLRVRLADGVEREFGDVEALAEHHGSLSAALLMEPLTPKQIDTLARLARAAMA